MLALWLAARATAFHVITTFREMCDHHGLSPGGVFCFTRDIKSAGLWSVLFHPRNIRLPPDPPSAAGRSLLPAARGAARLFDAAGVPGARSGLRGLLRRAGARGRFVAAEPGPVTTRTLGALQVAALLVSASYGIGFLFGSGEYALRYGMAGAIYGVATGLGMIAMAAFAGRLWLTGRPVWDLLGDRSGDRVRRLVALLSIVWMAGVLAAQIHGAVAGGEAARCGPGGGPCRRHRPHLRGIAVRAACSVPGLRRVPRGERGRPALRARAQRRRRALRRFAACVRARLAVARCGAGVHDRHRRRAARLHGRGLSPVRARGPWAGRRRPRMPAGQRRPADLLLAFLPPAVVLSAVVHPSWPGVADGKQVVPQALSLAAAELAAAAGPVMLGSTRHGRRLARVARGAPRDRCVSA